MTAPRPTWADSPRIRYAATISPCGLYRYDLEREFDAAGAWCMWIMLNPSKADGQQDDPTLRRCIDFSHGFGLPNLVVCNLYAIRSTDPRGVVDAKVHPVGPDNDATIRRWLPRVDLVLLAWGYSQKVGPVMLTRAWEARMRLRQAFTEMEAEGKNPPPVGHMGVTEGKQHQPRHPLMLKASTTWTRIDP